MRPAGAILPRALAAFRAGVPRLGVRGWLLTAFAVITSMTALASGGAFLSYGRLGATLNTIMGDSVAAMNASLQVARNSSEIATAAPSLVRARDKAELTAALAALAERQQDLARSIATLAGTADGGDAAHALEADAASMKR